MDKETKEQSSKYPSDLYEKINNFINHLDRQSFFDSVDKFYFYLDNDNVGILYVDYSLKEHDSSCQACQEEILAFGFRGPSDDIPYYFLAGVTLDQFNRIEFGWRESKGLDLKNIKFLRS
jgi:hypothetical protein